MGAEATLDLPSAIATNDATIVLRGPGASIPDLTSSAANNLSVNNGTFELLDGADLATNTGFTNRGTLVVGNGNTPLDTSKLTTPGGFTNDAGGTVVTRIGGRQADGLYGEIDARPGTGTLGGTFAIELVGGFTPPTGEQYPIIAYFVRAGFFATILGAAPYFDVNQTDTAVTLNGLNPPPTADPGGPYPAVEGSGPLQLDGSSSFDDGEITSYEWLPADAFDDNTVAQPLFTRTADDGETAVTLRVCDDGIGPAQQCAAAGTTVTVTNAPPTVVALIPPQFLTQGDTLGPIDIASFTDPGTADTHTVQIVWGDGQADTIASPAPTTVAGTHQYLRDGAWTLRVRVTDDDGGVGEVSIPVTVANRPPTVTPAAPVLDEGDATSTTLATIADVAGETFTATVDWGVGAGPQPATVNQVTDQVTGGFAYPDDDVYVGEVCVSDGRDTTCQPLTVTVENTPPAVSLVADQIDALAGGTVDIAGAYTDPGTADTHTATIDWGDGTTTPTQPVTNGAFTFPHTYPTPGTYTVQVCVTDDDTGTGCDTATIDVDAPPTADPGGPYTGTEGTPIPLDGSASTDPDGTITSWAWTTTDPTVTLTNPTTATPTLTTPDNGTYPLTLTVCDNDDLCNAADVTVTVTNVAPVVAAGGPATVRPGDPLTRDVSFTDPGTADTHTATIDWGDGTAIQPIDPATSPFPITHTFATTGTPTVRVCVTDDDAGIGCDTFVVTVTSGLTAVDDEFEVPEGSGDRVLDVLANDAGVGAEIIETTQPDPAAGTVTCTAVGCVFRAAIGFVGTATFEYTISDGGLQDTATVAVDVVGCADLTGAFAQPVTVAGAPWSLVRGYDWVECADPGAHATAGAALTPVIQPDGDDTLALLTTGLASQSDGTPGGNAEADHRRSYRGAFDASVLRLDLDVPATVDAVDAEGAVSPVPVQCVSFDVVFATEEFPDYVNKPYNDGFVAELDTSTWRVAGTEIVADDNIAFDPSGEVISVKGSFFDPGRVITDTGMSYNGSTASLRVRTPITPGAHQLYLSVFDGADGFQSSAAIVDHLVVYGLPVNGSCDPGASQPPDAADDAYTVDEDSTTVLDLLVNDRDADGDAITILEAPTLDGGTGQFRSEHGTLVVNAARTAVTYTPDRDFFGTDTFDYTITDRPNSSIHEPVAPASRATVTITVDEVNDAPEARTDYTTTPPAPVAIPVLANDLDVDGDPLTVVSHTDPLLGQVSCTETQCTYTPNAGYDGPDAFRYTIEDGRGGTATGTVVINAGGRPSAPGDPACELNRPPVADAGGPYDLDGQAALDGTGSFDPDGTIVSWQWVVDPPATLTGADSPTPLFSSPQGGVFRVQLIVCDDDGACGFDLTIVVDFVVQLTSPIDEGDDTRGTVEFFNPGGTLATTFDWGDGTPLEIVDPAIFPVIKSHTYPQDGAFDVQACVTGETVYGAVDACDTAPLEVRNVVPSLDAGVDRTLVTGGTLVQTRMSFLDPGADAPWTATVDWGDGSPIGTLDVNQGTKQLSMPNGHVYPTAGEYTVTVCVTDDDGNGCDSFVVNVSDIPPPTPPDGGSRRPLHRHRRHPHPPRRVGVERPRRHHRLVRLDHHRPHRHPHQPHHRHPHPHRPRQRQLPADLDRLRRRRPLQRPHLVTVSVANVAPQVSLIADQQATLVGAPVTVAGAYTDPATADTHTATVDWGDGTTTPAQPVTNGAFAFPHTYPTPGQYTVEVCVTDDDDGQGCDTATIDVDAPPTADPGGPYTGTEGTPIPLDGVEVDRPRRHHRLVRLDHHRPHRHPHQPHHRHPHPHRPRQRQLPADFDRVRRRRPLQRHQRHRHRHQRRPGRRRRRRPPPCVPATASRIDASFHRPRHRRHPHRHHRLGRRHHDPGHRPRHLPHQRVQHLRNPRHLHHHHLRHRRRRRPGLRHVRHPRVAHPRHHPTRPRIPAAPTPAPKAPPSPSTGRRRATPTAPSSRSPGPPPTPPSPSPTPPPPPPPSPPPTTATTR